MLLHFLVFQTVCLQYAPALRLLYIAGKQSGKQKDAIPNFPAIVASSGVLTLFHLLCMVRCLILLCAGLDFQFGSTSCCAAAASGATSNSSISRLVSQGVWHACAMTIRSANPLLAGSSTGLRLVHQERCWNHQQEVGLCCGAALDRECRFGESRVIVGWALSIACCSTWEY